MEAEAEIQMKIIVRKEKSEGKKRRFGQSYNKMKAEMEINNSQVIQSGESQGWKQK